MKNEFSEKKYVNRTAILGHTVIDTVLFLAYSVEVLKGARTIGYFTVFALLCMVPVIAEHLFFRQHPESSIIRYMIGISYSILYLFAIFTTNSLLTCTYVFPIFMVIILYMDIKYSTLIGVISFLGNIAYVAYHSTTVGYAKAEVADVEIRIAAMVLTVAFMAVTSKANARVNNEKIKVIQEQSQAAGALAENMLNTTGEMISDIRAVSETMGHLGRSMEQIHSYMGEVSSGSNETAGAVQLQLQKTEQIQQHIIHVKDAAKEIEENMNNTAYKVDMGRKQMDALEEQVENSMEADHRVVDQMKTLGEYAAQMNTIIETITSIANSTGMLALNASIEAARAGEAGRGFAVVANQISGLANQTKSATVNITGLIEHINNELMSVGEAVDVMARNNSANVESTQIVSENFTDITRGTDEIGRQAKMLMNIVNELESANASIMENIQTISAITEEVSAHASETYNACEANSLLVDHVTEVVTGLSVNARKLQGQRIVQ